MGDMANDAYDRLFDELHFDDSDCEQVCHRCGAEGLHWEWERDAWRLADVEGTIHHCVPNAEGFDAL